MSKRSLFPQSRRHIWVYDKDWAFLDAHFGDQSESKMGVGAMVREIVHNYVERLKARQAGAQDTEQQRKAPT
jgi:hypothetical protein